MSSVHASHCSRFNMTLISPCQPYSLMQCITPPCGVSVSCISSLLVCGMGSCPLGKYDHLALRDSHLWGQLSVCDLTIQGSIFLALPPSR